MALSASERARVLRILQRRRHAPPGCTKPQVLAAIVAADDWTEANAASFNTALPVAFRTTATPSEKAILNALVTLQRAGILPDVA